MTRDLFLNAEEIELRRARTPWPRLGKPEDIAYGALYLASDESTFVTGSELVIDGGYTAR
jgi:cyclopentanol dehydrogenase